MKSSIFYTENALKTLGVAMNPQALTRVLFGPPPG